MASNSRKPTPRSGRSAALTGRTIGDFEILEEIGRGGMGMVFRARQVSLDRVVALKVLSTSLGLTKQAITRFRREAQATAKLQHPNIVPVYAQGEEDDTYFYAMALVEGRSLRDIIVDLREGHDVGGATADGKSRSASGASAGTSAEAEDLALAETELLDRGSGGASEGKASRDGTDADWADSAAGPLEATGFEHYTDAYFDEIARQTCAVADALDYAHRHGIIHRDIKPHNLLVGDGDRLCLSDFGLARVLEQPGVTVSGEFVGSPLYMSPEQITGRTEAIGQATDVYSLGATLYEWLTLTPPFPGRTREEVISKVITSEPVAPRALNSHVPLDLETICLKALKKAPSGRYQSAAEMRDDLRRFVDRAGIKARRAGIVSSAVKAVSKRRVAATSAVAVVLISTLSFLLLREHRQAREVDAVREENVKLQEERSELADVMARIRRGEGPFAESAGEQSLPSGVLLTSEEESAEHRPVTEGQRIGAMFLISLCEAAQRRLQGVDWASIEPDSPEWHYLMALAAKSAEPALAHLADCLSVLPTHVEARLLRAWIRCQLSQGSEMLADAAEVLRIDPQRGEAYVVRGAANLLLENYESARTDLAEAEALMGRDYRLDLLTGVVLAGLGENDAAIVALSPALQTNPDCVLGLLKRAELYVAWGRHVTAIIDLTRVLELEPNNDEVLERRGECYDALERYDEAVRDYSKAMSISGGHEMLAAKVAAATVNRTEQRAAREAQAAAGLEEAPDAGAPRKVIEPPESPSAVLEWLQRFVEPREDDPDAQSRLPHSATLPFAYR